MKSRLIYLLPVAVAVGMAALLYQWTLSPPIPRSEATAPSSPSGPNGRTATLTSRPNGTPAGTLAEQARKALASGDHDQFIALLIQLVQIDPAAAAALAQSSGALRKEAMLRVAQHWSEADPDAAEKWAAALPDKEESKMALTSVCYQIAEKDPESAIAMAGQRGIGHEQGVFQDLAQQWAEKDFSAAEDWASAQPEGEERNNIYSRLAIVLAKTEPDNAVQLVLEQIPPGPVQTEAAISVLYQWAARDRAGAAAWVAKFPPGELRKRAEREIAGITTDQDNAKP